MRKNLEDSALVKETNRSYNLHVVIRLDNNQNTVQVNSPNK